MLSRDNEEFIQCGGGREACSVEVRLRDAAGTLARFVVGKNASAKQSTQISISQGGTWVEQGEVLTVAEYARFQELGFTGTMNVRKHLRTIKSAFGKTTKGGAVTFSVLGHARRVDYPAHSFLASALAELEGDFKASIRDAVARALNP